VQPIFKVLQQQQQQTAAHKVHSQRCKQTHQTLLQANSDHATSILVCLLQLLLVGVVVALLLLFGNSSVLLCTVTQSGGCATCYTSY
jgi:hypothetical protein